MNQALALTSLALPHVLDRRFQLAVHAERLGYSRYWVTEHFESKPGAIGSSIVAATMAASVTTKIRVGTAGILLRFYPAALAAIQFRALAALFPGRIDAGFCKGRTMNAEPLEADLIEWAYESKVERLVRDTCGTDWPPHDGPLPSLWYLGSSRKGAMVAAQLGLNYAHGTQFLRNDDDPTVITAYHDVFRPNEWQREASSCVAVAGYCSDSASDIERQMKSPLWAAGFNARVVGSPQVCRDRLFEIAEQYRVSELAFINVTRDPVAELRSLELLADAVSLPRPELP